MTDKRIVFSTTDSRHDAQRLALELVERKLAACVNVVGPIHSTYWWEGKVDSTEEYLLIIKSTAEKFSALAAAIKELHRYDVPECIAVDVTDGNREYLEWITSSVTHDRTQS